MKNDLNAVVRKFSQVENVDIWRADLDAPVWTNAGKLWLQEKEQTRASRYVFEKSRKRYIAARSALRYLLGLYREVSPAEICFQENAYGKPMVKGGPLFNLSHADNLAVYAISPDREVGIDVERIREVKEANIIATQWFEESERILYQNECQISPEKAFFQGWVRMESRLKALGVGLGAKNEASWDRNCWSRYDLDLGPEWVCALVVQK
jgi:4'-phosphopantetheinyl transferase